MTAEQRRYSDVDVHEVVAELGVSVAAYAAPLDGAGDGIGVDAEALASPASVLKVQVALTVERAIADGSPRRASGEGADAERPHTRPGGNLAHAR